MEDSNFNLETAIASSDVKGIPVTSIMMSDLQWGIQGLQGSQGVDLQPKTLSTCWKILAAAASGLVGYSYSLHGSSTGQPVVECLCLHLMIVVHGSSYIRHYDTRLIDNTPSAC
eukprot:scaffold55951_cov19-Tisochrysis_lutea.AAC.1